MDTLAVGTESRSAGNESARSAVSWAPVFAGAFVALAIALVLLTLGGGLGLASLSPWPTGRVSATTFGITTAIALIVVHWVASASGGYITGRLRLKWVGVHSHEVFFRDTAHGLLTWALTTVIGAVFLMLVASSVIGAGVQAGATVAGGAAQSASSVSAYDIDSLFRSDHPDAAANPQPMNAQASRILVTGLTNGGVPAADRTALVQMVAARTGLSDTDAQKRVDTIIARVKDAEAHAMQTADAARKASSELAIFTALAMLIGAFIASVAAAYGGSLRDER
jgi:hypothetical protein